MTPSRTKAAPRRSIVQQAVAVVLSVGALAGAFVSSPVAAQSAYDVVPAGSTSSAPTAGLVNPSAGAVTYTLSYTPTSGTAQSVDVTYDFAKSAWQAPAGWSVKVNADGSTSLTRIDSASGSALQIKLAAAPVIDPATVVANTTAPINVDSYDGTTTSTKQFMVLAPDAKVSGAVVGYVASLAAPAVVLTEVTANGETSQTDLAGDSIVEKQNSVKLSVADTAGSFMGPLMASSVATPELPAAIADRGYTVDVAGKVTGSSMTVNKGGINFSAIKGTSSLNADGSLSINATETPTFTVDAATGNTFVGGTLEVKGLTTTNGISNTGNITTGTLTVTGATATNGLTNKGNITTDTLTVSGATVTNGLTNNGDLTNSGRITTGTLTVTGTTSTTGISNTGNLVNAGNLTVTGTTTTNGITNTGDIATSGQLTAASLSTSGNATVGGSLNVAGPASIGGPLSVNGRISGVQDGVAPTDAVNLRQLDASQRLVSRGVASASALSGIPQLEQGKSFSVGAGMGNFNGQAAVAIGFSARLIRENIVVRAGVAGASGGKSTGSAGVGYSW
jgi:hypothetical protein